MDLNEEFWIKKTVRNIVKDAKKDTENEVLTVTLADANGTNISIRGDPNKLGWLESGLDVSVHIKEKVTQSTLAEETRPQKNKEQLSDEDWDPDVDG